MAAARTETEACADKCILSDIPTFRIPMPDIAAQTTAQVQPVERTVFPPKGRQLTVAFEAHPFASRDIKLRRDDELLAAVGDPRLDEAPRR